MEEAKDGKELDISTLKRQNLNAKRAARFVI